MNRPWLSFRSRVVALIVLATALPGRALAQQPLPLAEILPQLLGNTIILQPTSLPDQPNHQAHFQPGPDQLEAPRQFNSTLLTLLSTSPVASPSGGFTYTFDPALGTFRRTSESFGPTFAERALTIGRGRVSVGYGYQHASYDTFEGLNLRDRGAVTFYVPHLDCCSRAGGTASQPDDSRLTPAFEGDLVRAELALDLTTDSSVFVVNYGVHDRLDIGVVVPFLHVSMNASVLASVERLSTATEPETHTFGGADPRQLALRRKRRRDRTGRPRAADQVPAVARGRRRRGRRRGRAGADRRRVESSRDRRRADQGLRHRLVHARQVRAAPQRRLHVLEQRRPARYAAARRGESRGGVRLGAHAAGHAGRRLGGPVAARRRADARGRQDLRLRGGRHRRGWWRRRGRRWRGRRRGPAARRRADDRARASCSSSPATSTCRSDRWRCASAPGAACW